jgi:hypothetical protein
MRHWLPAVADAPPDGDVMEARQLIGNSSYGPEQLTVLFQAFDRAWEELAPRVGDDPAAIEAARMQLANVMLALAANGQPDAERLKTAALQLLPATFGRSDG